MMRDIEPHPGAQLGLDFGGGTQESDTSTTAVLIPTLLSEVYYFASFFGKTESDFFFATLRANTHWKEEQIELYGKVMDVPRQTAWYGDNGKSYTDSKINAMAEPWTSALLVIKSRIEAVSGVRFNSVFLNLYKDGNDSVAWHSDDEPELGPHPIIGSVSLGESRRFQFRSREDSHVREEVFLHCGDYMLMKGQTQRFWAHRIPKTKTPCVERINLTFRIIP